MSMSAGLGSMPGQCRAGISRLYHATGYNFMPDIVVPPMGDSISEGSVAAILKKEGDRVNLDDTIAQIETDKVTIDVKTPTSGTVSKLLIKPSDVVKPGQVVAVVGAGVDATASTSAPQAAAHAAAPSNSAPAPGHRVAGISFPPRRTSTGDRISDLPAAKQDAILSSMGAAHAHPAPAPATPAPAAPAASAPAPAPASKATAVPTTSSSTTTMDIPPRRKLTKTEMELINSGGAF